MIIPAPDLTMHVILAFSFLALAMGGMVVGLLKEKFYIIIPTMVIGMTMFLYIIILAHGFGSHYDGLVDVWADQITNQINNTECEDLQDLSYAYKKSDIDTYDVKQFREQIKERYIYNCVDTRDGLWLED